MADKVEAVLVMNMVHLDVSREKGFAGVGTVR
jgi:hypothetical protein